MENDKNPYILDDYIGLPPGWMVKHGTLLFGFFLILMLLLASLIRYNDVIKSEISITTSIPPTYVSSKTSGIISDMMVGSGDMVTKGQILAVVQNTSKTNDILKVLEALDGRYDTITSIESLALSFPQNLQLGEVQSDYNNYVSSYQAYINFNSLQRESLKKTGLKRQAKSQIFALSNQRKKLELSKKRTQLAQEQFRKQEGLYQKGVISQSELSQFQERLLESEQQTQNNYQQLSLLSVQSSKLESAYLDSGLNFLELQENYLSSLMATRQELVSRINKWKNNYLLVSPSDGKISVFDIWEKYQNVEKDDFIFSIIPEEGGEILGKLKVPLNNSGKIRLNQEVVIKLDNYPFREWGALKGEIKHISDVPKKGEESYYSVFVELENLNTSFGKKIKFKQEMTGSAEIILDRSSLLERIFYQFKGIWE